MILTMVVSFYHTYGSMKLMRPGNDWEKGIPSDPYPNAPKNLQMVKNNIKNLFEYPIIFYVLLRIAHSFYHLFMNNTHLRGGCWLISQFVLLAILIRFIFVI